MVGVVLFATLALMPPMLQGLMGYPVLAAGLVTAPRGIGTWVSMAVVGRLTGRVDARLLIAIGFGLGAISLWQMGIALAADGLVARSSGRGVIQGFGTGLAYVSLTIVAFVTLPAALRNEGAAFFNLMRNIGSSVGISLDPGVCHQQHRPWRMRASPKRVTPFNPAADLTQVGSQIGSTAGSSGSTSRSASRRAGSRT